MKFSDLLKGDKKIKMIMFLGMIGIVVIGLSTFLPKKDAQAVVVKEDKSIEQYKTQLEQEVMELVTSIQGVGKAKVMITIKNGVEYVYAKEEKQNTDQTNGALGTDQAVQQRETYEQKTIIVEDPNGRKIALLKTTLEPTVKGVVIVCEGGDDVLVQQQVVEAVKTAMGIGANKVCVSKLNI